MSVNNNQDDDFLDVDLGDDNGFKEYNNGSSKTLGDLFASPAAKIGLLAAGAIIIVAGMMLFGGKKEEARDSLVAKPPEDVKEAPGTAELTPAVKEAIDQYNEQNVEQAIKTGESAIPVPTTTPQEPAGFDTAAISDDDPVKVWRDLQAQRQAQPAPAPDPQVQIQKDQARAQTISNLAQTMTAQMNSVLGDRTPKNLQVFTVTGTEEEQLAAARANGTLDLSDGALSPAVLQGLQQASLVPPVVPKTLLPAGKVEYAQLLLEANSDIPGPVLAQIVSGPFAGGRVLGSFQSSNKKFGDQYLILSFNMLIDKKGNNYPINAIGVDPATTLTGLATEVDNRYLERIILPAAAKFIEGTAQAAAESGQTTVTATSTSTTEETQRDVDVEQEIFNGLEEGARELGDELDQAGNDVKPLVKVAAGTAMGILFVQPVQEVIPVQPQPNDPSLFTGLAGNPALQGLLQQQNPYAAIQGLGGVQGGVQPGFQQGFGGANSFNPNMIAPFANPGYSPYGQMPVAQGYVNPYQTWVEQQQPKPEANRDDDDEDVDLLIDELDVTN